MSPAWAPERLGQLLMLVDREAAHLLAVRSRLLGEDLRVDAERMAQILGSPEGIDRLESFGAKFARMQGTVVDKLIPTLITAVGEQPAAAIDNLARMERLHLVASADDWLKMRLLRNRLVHEYFDDPALMAAALTEAGRFTDAMCGDFQAIQRYLGAHPGLMT